ncbi:MAG: monofunctional biosynthetic peptidoglycan transglycosylase [Deltaproteobacteria bacterium]|nr:monofunctional biosynthetic peptidoglycan transglycosylase [Deltaproteobacteria bacterium]
MTRTHVLYAFAVSLLITAALTMTYQGGRSVADFYHRIFPDTSVMKTQYPVAVAKVGPQITYKFQKQRPPHWVNLGQISKQAVAAILMSEDSGFFQHHGYEPEAIRAAIEHNTKPGVKVKRGGSTITQQVVKNLFLSPEKTITRKVRELLLAMEIERKYSKKKILETYLNIAEWGPGVYGIEQASQRYFKKNPADLTAHDAAVLAFMLPNPTKYQHSVRDGELTAFAQKSVETILERMWKTGHISDEEYTSSEVQEEIPSNL